VNRPIFFSVIIPTYNRASHIEATLNSVLAQTYPNFEVIVVDDGSTDNTREVVASLKDTRIRYFWKENEERNIARNFGVSVAQGDYINFLDSDDKQYEHHLQSAYERLNEIDLPEFLCFRSDFREEDGSYVKELLPITGNLNKHIIRENLLQFNGVFLRKDIAKVFKFVEDRNFILSEDWYLWLKLAARYRLHYSNNITTSTVRHPKRSLNNLELDKVIYSKKLLVSKLLEDEVFVSVYKKYLNYFVASSQTFIALILCENSLKRESLTYMWNALRIYPMIVVQKRFLATLKNIFL
jgi:glycosyltransferase involved in cell wall biosynthesis